MNDFEKKIADELQELKGEREADIAAIESAKASFAEELKNTLGDDMRDVLSAEPQETEEKKGAVSKFFEKLARVCR